MAHSAGRSNGVVAHENEMESECVFLVGAYSKICHIQTHQNLQMVGKRHESLMNFKCAVILHKDAEENMYQETCLVRLSPIINHCVLCNILVHI